MALLKSEMKIAVIGTTLLFFYAASILSLIVAIGFLLVSTIDLDLFPKEFSPAYMNLAVIGWITMISVATSILIGILAYIDMRLIRIGITTALLLSVIVLVIAFLGIFFHLTFTNSFEHWSEQRYGITLDNPQNTYSEGQIIAYNNGNKATIHGLDNGKWVIYDATDTKEMKAYVK